MSNSEYNRTIGKTIDRKQSDTIVVATVRLSSDAIIRYMDYRPNGVFDSSWTLTMTDDSYLLHISAKASEGVVDS